MSLALVCLILSAAGAASAAPSPGLRLHAATNRPVVLVGEPMRFDLRWNSSVATRTTSPPDTGFRFVIQDEQGAVRTVAALSRERNGTWVGATDIPAGFERHATSVLALDNAGAIPIAAPGKYVITVEHAFTGVRSNPIRLKVDAATGGELPALMRYRQFAALFNGTLDTRSGPAAAAFIRDFPRSAYAQWLKAQLFPRAPWYVV